MVVVSGCSSLCCLPILPYCVINKTQDAAHCQTLQPSWFVFISIYMHGPTPWTILNYLRACAFEGRAIHLIKPNQTNVIINQKSWTNNPWNGIENALTNRSHERFTRERAQCLNNLGPFSIHTLEDLVLIGERMRTFYILVYLRIQLIRLHFNQSINHTCVIGLWFHIERKKTKKYKQCRVLSNLCVYLMYGIVYCLWYFCVSRQVYFINTWWSPV